MATAVHLAKLAQMEEEGELSGHVPERQEGGQDLGEQEEEVDGVDGSLQRQDDYSFIGQEEQQHWQLEHERQEPEACQLWHLMTAKQRESTSVDGGDAKIEQSDIKCFSCIHTHTHQHTHQLHGQLFAHAGGILKQPLPLLGYSGDESMKGLCVVVQRGCRFELPFL